MAINQKPTSIWQWVHFLSCDYQKPIGHCFSKAPPKFMTSSRRHWALQKWLGMKPEMSDFLDDWDFLIVWYCIISLGFDTTVGKLLFSFVLRWGCGLVLHQWIGPMIIVILTIKVNFLCAQNWFLFQFWDKLTSGCSFNFTASTFHSQSNSLKE